MAEKNNATCSICGNPYHLCLSCKDSIQLAPWKIHTDTSEHYKIFQVVRGFSTGIYTKEETRDKFKNIDLSDLENFRPHIKLIIEDILKEPVVEVIKKPTVSQKRNNKKVKVDVDEKNEDVIENIVDNDFK